MAGLADNGQNGWKYLEIDGIFWNDSQRLKIAENGLKQLKWLENAEMAGMALNYWTLFEWQICLNLVKFG